MRHPHGQSNPLTSTSHSRSKEPASPTHTLTPLPRGTPLVGPGTIPTIQARNRNQIHIATLGTEPPPRAAYPPRPSHMANASESIVRISSLCTERYAPTTGFAVAKYGARSLRPARLVKWDRRPARRRVGTGGPEVGNDVRRKW
jgi:hypothetical protein